MQQRVVYERWDLLHCWFVTYTLACPRMYTCKQVGVAVGTRAPACYGKRRKPESIHLHWVSPASISLSFKGVQDLLPSSLLSVLYEPRVDGRIVHG